MRKKERKKTNSFFRLVILIITALIILGVSTLILQSTLEEKYQLGISDGLSANNDYQAGRLSVVDQISRTGNIYVYSNDKIVEISINKYCEKLNSLSSLG